MELIFVQPCSVRSCDLHCLHWVYSPALAILDYFQRFWKRDQNSKWRAAVAHPAATNYHAAPWHSNSGTSVVATNHHLKAVLFHTPAASHAAILPSGIYVVIRLPRSQRPSLHWGQKIIIVGCPRGSLSLFSSLGAERTIYTIWFPD